jgi:integrase
VVAEKARRAYGSGSLTQRADGRWQATLSLGMVSGKRQRRTVYGKSRREVAEKLAALRRQHATGQLVTASREPVAALLTRWLRDVIAIERPPTTLQQYSGHVGRYLTPALGTKKLADVTPADLQALYAQMHRDQFAPATIRLTHAVAHAAFEWAVDMDYLVRNPADRAHPPSKTRTPRPTLDADQARYLLHAVAGDELEPLWWLLLTTGIRIGEALRLEWAAISLPRRTVQVRAAKTPRGRRLVPLCTPTVERLRAHEGRLAAAGSSYVFARPDGRPWSDTTIRAQRWYPLLDRLNLPRVHLHDLRHTCATLLLELGVHPRIVAEILGHSGIGITMDIYSHVSEAISAQAVEALGTLLTAAPPAPVAGASSTDGCTIGSQ